MLPPEILDQDPLYHLQWWVEDAKVETFVKETGDGFLYVCEECGAPWAAKYFPNRAVLRFYGACPKHSSSRGEVPGSLVLWWHDELERMPAVLVEREYDIHLAYYERENGQQDKSFVARNESEMHEHETARI